MYKDWWNSINLLRTLISKEMSRAEKWGGDAKSWQKREISVTQRIVDDIHFKWRETKQPLSQWKWRHYTSLCIFQHYIIRPIQFLPGVIACFYFQPGRRFGNNFKKLPLILPKLFATNFWKSGVGQGYHRLPFSSPRMHEAYGDFAVVLMVTWPIWFWTRLYYAFQFVDFVRTRPMRYRYSGVDEFVAQNPLQRISSR